MSYPRKRALLACDFCRQRKRRCDGRKPICGNCAEAEADCHYQELPIQRLMAGNLPSAMAKRLERIEALLKVHADAIAELREESRKKGGCTADRDVGVSVGVGVDEAQQIAALEQSNEDIEHDIPAVLTYLATSGQHHNYSHHARNRQNNRNTPAPLALDSGIRKPTPSSSSYRTSKQSSTPDHHIRDRDHKLTHVPSPPNSTSSAASATASINGLSPQLHTVAPTAASAAPVLEVQVPKPGISTSSLLAFPTLRSLVGGFPEDYFLRIEMQRAAPTPTASSLSLSAGAELPYLNRDVTDLLVTTFFAVVHPSHPLFGARRDCFLDTYEKVVARGLAHDAQSALCLVVFALGAIASSSSISSSSFSSGSGAGAAAAATTHNRDVNGAPGMEYFLPAQQVMMMLDSQTFTGDMTLAQALVLGGVYLSYVSEPVKSWKVVHMAGKQVQLLGMRWSEGEEMLVQIACACYSLERDLWAEFGLPTSGIARVIDDFFFSASNTHSHVPAYDHDTSKYAECHIQRIIARAHDALYSPALTRTQSNSNSLASPPPQQQQQHNQPSLSLPSTLSIAADFERQLALWYDDSFAPNNAARCGGGSGCGVALENQSQNQPATAATSDERERMLRLRYWEARIVVCKPFLLFCARGGGNETTEIIPAVVYEKAQACVESCRLYIQTAAEMLKKPARHTWLTCQLSIHAVLLCTIASMAPRLAHWVPDVAELQQCVMDGAAAWAVPESSAEAGVWVVGDIRRRQRFCLGS